MRLAYVTRQFPCAQIGEAFLAAEVRELARRCELHLFPVRPQSAKSAFGDLGAIEACVPAASWQTIAAAARELLAHPLMGLRTLATIVGSGAVGSAKIKNLACFPKGLALARYVRANQVEHIHAHWMTTPGTVAFIASRMTGVPWSCTAHAHDIFSGNLIACKAKSARFVRAIAQRNAQALCELAGTTSAPVHVVHLGVAVPAHGAPSHECGPLRILCAARLDPIKGHGDLLDALARLRDLGTPFRCELAGNGPLSATLQRRITELNLHAAVTLRGLVEHDDLLKEIHDGRYDVQVLVSHEDRHAGAHEGIPVSLMEAMAAAVPCVSTSTGCIPELIVKGTGVLVPQRDPATLAVALADMHRRADIRVNLGVAARARVIEHFNAGTTAQALYELLCEATAEAGARENAEVNDIAQPASIPIANAN